MQNQSAPSNTYTQTVNHSRRTPSNATTSTISSQGGPARTTSSASATASLRRSASSRSGQSFVPTSYVALMRKQKATVWCDRSQHEDPRMVAQAKAAKLRAAKEIVGANAQQGRASTSGSFGNATMSGVSTKIRSRTHHHLVGGGSGSKQHPATAGYQANLLGTTGVPMRLSASEVGDDGDDSDDDADVRHPGLQKAGSGRSSLASGHRLAAFTPHPPGRLSTGSTPPSGRGSSPAERGGGNNEVEPAVPQRQSTGDYFEHPHGNGGSGSSGSGESSFGQVGDMQAPSASVMKENEGKAAEDLIRRGSVDERATTMRGPYRLFVANPDVDSD